MLYIVKMHFAWWVLSLFSLLIVMFFHLSKMLYAGLFTWMALMKIQGETRWSYSKLFYLYTTSVAGVLTSSDIFHSPCMLEEGEVVPETSWLLQDFYLRYNFNTAELLLLSKSCFLYVPLVSGWSVLEFSEPLPGQVVLFMTELTVLLLLSEYRCTLSINLVLGKQDKGNISATQKACFIIKPQGIITNTNVLICLSLHSSNSCSCNKSYT